MWYLIQKSYASRSLALTLVNQSWRMEMSSQSLMILRWQKSESEQETSMVPLKLINIILQSTMNKILSHKYPFSNVTTYTRRGRHRPSLSFKVGDNLSGFELLHSKYYKDFDLTHLHFMNKENRGQIHQLECAEENNTLSMIFKTEGVSKPGMNYALEKLLQCGSKKYPVRNLAHEMSRRSFSLLGQPQTTDDYLMFSFNTPIIKDFSNLFRVYCSMLFDPLLREQDFYEVVRRLTFDEKVLGFTGELASELYEGQFQVDQTVYSIINQALLGQKTQSLCRPLELLNISYGEVMKYYKEIITIPNCTMVLHGDMNVNHFIDLCNNNFKEFKASTHTPIFVKPTPLPPSQKKTVFFQHLKQETMLMFSFKIENATEQEMTLLQILSYLLFDMPESPFLKFNSPQTPYPSLYGFHQRYFNIGITCFQPAYNEEKHMQTAQTFKKRQKFLLEKQSQILQTLRDIVKDKFNSRMIEKCLFHLQNNYYQKRGIKVIESLTERIINGAKIDSAFEVTSLITKLLKTFRKNNVFQNLVQKFMIDNENYITLRGFNNPDIIERENNNNKLFLAQMQFSLPGSQLTELQNYSSPNMLQDFSMLPEISPNELEFFQDLSGENIQIGDFKTVFSPRHHGNKFTFKFDLTDIGEDDIPLLSLFCKAFPQMGIKNINERAYSLLLQTYISRLDMNYECIKDENGQLKIYAFLTIEFIDRNYQYAMSVLTGLLTDFNQGNISALSKSMHLAASNCFNELSEDILHVHGLHLAASKSPFVFFESPIFQARTLCGLAGQMKKVLSPKGYLMGLASKMQEIWNKMMGWSRVELLWECHTQKKQFYKKHITILLSQITQEGIPPAGIDVSGFPKEKWQKYFPNFDNQLVFEAFSVPYREVNSPQILVLSSIINENILNFNQIGGCFVYKGALISFLSGTRTKFIELEDYYKKIDNLDVAKRRIFQRFDRYTVQNQFKSGVGFAQARNFKEAVLSVEKSKVEQVLNDYILSSIKGGTSSVLCLGDRLENYDPLLKKGWQIQRSIDDLSLGVQSLSKQQIRFNPQRYIDIS